MHTENLITRFFGMNGYGPDPFGAPLVVVGEEAEGNPFRFSTKYSDGESGVVYYGYRYYSPSLSRWLSRDPIGETGARLSSGFDAQKKGMKAKERLQKLRKISERDAVVATAVARLIARLEHEVMRSAGDYPMTVLVQGSKSPSSPKLIFNDYNFCLNRPLDAIDVLGLKVTNNGKCSLIVKPENGGFGNSGNPPVLLDPGETYGLPQDGVISCCPDDGCPIYKTVDGVDVTLTGNGGWSGGNGVSHTGGLGQWCGGGCRKVGFTTDGAWGTQDQINSMCLNAVILP